jgi:hypothetical protein
MIVFCVTCGVRMSIGLIQPISPPFKKGDMNILQIKEVVDGPSKEHVEKVDLCHCSINMARNMCKKGLCGEFPPGRRLEKEGE